MLISEIATPAPALADHGPCDGTGLRNSGFEDGIAGGPPACWTVASSADRVEVVGTEGPADFTTYARKNITVEPPRGAAMLALGTPKRQAESQPGTPDGVSQTFVATSDSLELQLRVFSWEHQGEDLVRVAIDGGASADLSLEDIPTFTSGGCAAGVCEFEIDTGRRRDKRLLDTGWRVASLTGLQSGVSYTLETAIGSTGNNSFATWGYVDDVNSPPVARYDLDRPDDCSFASTGPLFEGQPLPLADCSYDPDGEVVAREWTITFPEGNLAVTDTPTGFVIPADQGSYTIELTVTDDGGLTDTITVPGGPGDCVQDDGGPGTLASDGTCLPGILIQDAPTLVDAVDVQAVAGSEVELVARYGDAGAGDDHVVTVDDGSSLDRCTGPDDAPCYDEDNLPAVETGIVLGEAAAPTVAGASKSVPITVTDTDTGVATTDMATITAIVDDSTQFEQELTTTDDARSIAVGSRAADWIDQPGDIDLFRVEWPGAGGQGAQDLPAGTELLVNLRDLPADYDLAVLVGRPGATTPGQILPGQILPGQILPGQILPGQILPGQITPGQILPGQILPGQILPGQILPGQILPGQILPGQILPGQILPGQILQMFRTPGQILPGQILPGQILPGQILPGQILSSVYDLADPATATGLSPYAVNPFQLYPLSLRAYTGTNGTNLTGSDVDLDELGLGQIADGLRVAAYSANRGIVDDNALVRIDEPGSEVYVVVIGANGEFSDAEPYALQVEASAPFDSLVLASGRTDLFGGACEREYRGGGGTTSVTSFSEGSDGDGRDTLFVTSWERLEWSAQQADPTAPSLAHDKIDQLVAEVGGAVLDLGGAEFAAWDEATCAVDAANAVAELARDAVQAELAAHDYEHVVVVGGDDVVAFRRSLDETTYSNETQYATSSFLAAGQPLFASMAGGFNLTDNHLADAVPTPWRGRSLWVPDVPTARLVETEVEIAAQVDAFLDPAVDGRLDIGTAFVTGSEFFDDGSAAVAAALGERATTSTLINASDDAPNELATAADYRCALLGVGCAETGGTSLAGDVNAVNAHYQHFAMFSPAGAATADAGEVVATTEVNQNLAGSLYVTIGCHGGLAVPDDEAQVDELASGLQASLDFAQAMARQQAVMIANTGFGLGEDTGVGYSELLQLFVAEGLRDADPGATVGDVVLAAQQRYVTSISQFDEYHEKTLVQTTVYGLPFYEIGGDSGSSGSADAAANTSTSSSGSVPFTTGAGDITATATLDEIATDRGTYYEADGRVIATVERPKQPVVVVDVPTDPQPAHGVLIRHEGVEPTGPAGTYMDEDGFDPVIHAPNSEWLAGGAERQICLDAWWPSTIAQLNTHELEGGDLLQTVSIKPGQFRCTSGGAAEVTGTQRLFDGLPIQLLRSDSPDWQAPVIRRVDFEKGVADDSLLTTIRLDDASDLAEIVVLRLLAGVVTSEDHTGFSVDDDTVSFTLADLQDDEGFLIQLADSAGNVTTYTGKSTVPSFIAIDATGPAVAFPGVPLTLTATIPDYEAKVASGELVEPVWYSWAFGATVTHEGRTVDRISGLVAPGATTDTVITIDGDATISVTAVYDDSAPDHIVASARVVDSDGGIGVDRHTMRRACDAVDLPAIPDADLVTCGLDFGAVTSGGDPGLGFTVGVAGMISDPYQYRIGFDTNGNGRTDKTVKYVDGKLTGPLDATAELTASGELLVTFELADLTTSCPQDSSRLCVIWQVETQSGVPGGSGQGFLDRMRDGLTVTEVPD